MGDPNEPIDAEIVGQRRRRKFPIVLTILLALGFGATMAIADGGLVNQPLNAVAIAGLIAKGLSHAVAAAALLETLNWLWTKFGK